MTKEKRPKDMTQEELKSLPIMDTLRDKDKGIKMMHRNRDDIIWFTDEQGDRWGFGQYGDGSWYRQPF